MKSPGSWLAAVFVFGTFLAASGVVAQKRYDPGVSDVEIRIGNIMPYRGPASAYGIIGETEAAYIKMINAQGGIHGRKINFISYDDGYSPPKTVEQGRKLVEDHQVLLIFNSPGTPTNTTQSVYERQTECNTLRRCLRGST
jgi:ABC-type branched-subunit amino acid transport system substrate-binding protein